MRHIIKKTIRLSEAPSYINGVKAFANSLDLKIEVIEIRTYTYFKIFKYQSINIIIEGNQYEVENFIVNI